MVLKRFSLHDTVVIVTGAGRGRGQQMALALVGAGVDLVCAAQPRSGGRLDGRVMRDTERTENGLTDRRCSTSAPTRVMRYEK